MIRPSLILAFLAFLLSVTATAQVKPSITYDPSTGDYIVKYQGHEGDDERPVLVRVVFEPSTKVFPEISASAFMLHRLNRFEYSYTVKNLKISKQRLLYFELEQRTKSIDSTLIPNHQWKAGLWGGPPRVHWGHTMVSPDGMGTPYNGIGIDSLVSGFAIICAGLPTVLNTYSRGLTRGISFPDEPPSEVEMVIDSLSSFPNNCVIRKSIGPSDPSKEFEAFEFLDTLLSYIHQSHHLGWINNTRDDDAEEDEKAEDGIVKNLDKRLGKIRDLVDRDKIPAARSQLQRFLRKVERLWDRQQNEDKRNRKNPRIIFTSEAYALLKYNGEYLLDHLTEAKEEKKDKKRKEK
jgi:hypothetical protein